MIVGATLLAAVVGLAAVSQTSRAQISAMQLRQVEGVTELSQLCEPDNIKQLVGPPVGGVEDVESAIFGLAVQLDIADPAKIGMGRVFLGLYSYSEESQRLLPEYIALVQRQLNLPPSQVSKRHIQPCPNFFSATSKTSRPHKELLRISRGIFRVSVEPIVLATVTILREAPADARPRVSSKPPTEREPPAAKPPKTGLPEAKKPPAVAAVPPKAAEPPAKRPDAGCDLDCMLEAEKRARASKGPDAKAPDTKAPGPGPDGKTASAAPWAPEVKAPTVPLPPTITERPPPADKADATIPSDPAASPVMKLKRYPAPHYAVLAEPLSIAPGGPAPDAAGLPVPDAGARTAFAVESVECSDEGNWIVGYFGFLTSKPDGSGQFSVRQRYAVNNYPGEGVSTLGELQRATRQLECGKGNDCQAPRRTIPYAEFLRSRTPPPKSEGAPVVVPKDKGVEWRCRPEKGICLSRETDHWRCDGGKETLGARCISYDPARWWCVPRREFCYQTVPFGDWGSPYKEGSLITIQLQPKKDASGQNTDQDHVYDMSHGILSIAQDVLTRRCSRHSGPAKEWKASWFNQSAN